MSKKMLTLFTLIGTLTYTQPVVSQTAADLDTIANHIAESLLSAQQEYTCKTLKAAVMTGKGDALMMAGTGGMIAATALTVPSITYDEAFRRLTKDIFTHCLGSGRGRIDELLRNFADQY